MKNNSLYSWNPVFNLVMEIKQDYINTFNDGVKDFEVWMDKLNKEKYNEVFDCVEVSQKGNFIIVRYGLLSDVEGLWKDSNSILRECRSIVIDIENDSIVLAPFRKFFNLNETEDNQIDKVREKMRNAKVIEFADKLDGSMQSATFYNGEVFMSGSRSIDKKQSWRLADGYSMLTDNYVRMLEANPLSTFIFEYISLKDSHVVHYKEDQEGLYLIGIRSKLTGKIMNYQDVQKIADIYNVPMANIETYSLDEILVKMKTEKSENKEGWVLNIDGELIKIKCDDYVNIHKILDVVGSVNVIIKAIADDTFDDLVSKVPDEYKDRVLNIAQLIFNYRYNTMNSIKYWFDSAPKIDRKTFMIWVVENVPKNLQKYVMSEYTGKKYNVLKNGVAGYKNMKQMGYEGDYSAFYADRTVKNV